ncbi:MocR-like transcription factor YczR [Pseudonocardia bannensis]|uniref:MocR-like transcription factor YczR n=1 Tax=Pseudonocardia bannensis TaxID=630973 RepID=UPI0028B17CC3|nr:PLP-dependent aminotransferase family protein [Pseudonocardia bannensis]
MDDIERRISARSFARLLGGWRPSDGRRLAAALTERIRLLVLDGRLSLQTRVPAERELAAALDVSRTTVAAAYDALRDAGFLHSRRGAGSWTRLPDTRPGAPAVAFSPFSPQGDDSLFDLAHAALPAPTEEIRRAAAEALGDLDGYLSGHGYHLHGLPVLRAAIADRFTARGLPTTAEQILVTTGAQHAIALALTALTGPGDRVLVEHPTYPNALDAVHARGGRCVPVALGPDGTWDVDLFTAAVRDAAPRLAYLIPDFQNPTGALMDGTHRAGMVALARRTGTPLLIDETLAELPLDGPAAKAPPSPVAAHGGGESPLLLTVGSASKVFWGGLRIGWIRSSAAMIRRLAALRPAIDLGGAVLDQLVTARLITTVESAAAARRGELAAARDHLLGRLGDLFPGWRPSRPAGGLSLWVDLGAPVSSRLAGSARRHGVLLAAGPRFGLDGAFERYLRLPFTLRPDRVEPALARLTAAWHGLDDTAPTDVEPVAVA